MTPPRAFHLRYRDGQAFEFVLDAPNPTRAQLEWQVALDYPEAAFVWEGERLTAWESEPARQRGEPPVAVIEPVELP